MKAFLLIGFTLLTTFAFGQVSKFSGTWAVDTSRTDFNELPKYVLPAFINVAGTNDSLVTDRFIYVDGKSVSKVHVSTSLNGGISTNGGGSTNKITSVANLNGEYLELSIQTSAPDGTPIAKINEHWSIIDGTVLKIDRKVEEVDGLQYQIVGYYKKEK